MKCYVIRLLVREILVSIKAYAVVSLMHWPSSGKGWQTYLEGPFEDVTEWCCYAGKSRLNVGIH